VLFVAFVAFVAGDGDLGTGQETRPTPGVETARWRITRKPGLAPDRLADALLGTGGLADHSAIIFIVDGN
jgi:hypothetical protein